MSLPKGLHPLAKDMPIPSEWLVGNNINARITKIKSEQKAFRVDETYYKPIFLNKIKKTGRDFQKPLKINRYKDKRTKKTYKKARS